MNIAQIVKNINTSKRHYKNHLHEVIISMNDKITFLSLGRWPLTNNTLPDFIFLI